MKVEKPIKWVCAVSSGQTHIAIGQIGLPRYNMSRQGLGPASLEYLPAYASLSLALPGLIVSLSGPLLTESLKTAVGHR